METKLKMAKKESGYAWFVVFCSFALNFITDGVAYTFGIFFSELLQEFKSSKAAGSWVPSIMTGLTFCVGPVVSALTNRYGCRTISMAGTTLAAVGYLLSTFALNVSTLYFTIGVMAGVGFGLMYLPCIVIITQYFTTRLALATGLAVSAAGIGSAVFAPLTEYLIRRFGWRIAMQAIALTLFVSGLFALSFKDFEYDDTSTDYDEETSVYDEVSKQKIVKFNEKDDLCAEEEKLMKNDNLADKLCNGKALTKQNKIQLSQSSLNSVTSNEQHNRIINSHLSRPTVEDSLDERSEQTENGMLIPISEQDASNEMSDDKEPDNEQNEFDQARSSPQGQQASNQQAASGGGAHDEMEPSGAEPKTESNLSVSNLLTSNLATSLNTNLNNLTRTNEIPRLSLDSSANYRLHQQLQHHHLQLKREDKANLHSTNTISEDANNNVASDQMLNELNESQTTLANQPNQVQYKSFNSLHPNFNVPALSATPATPAHPTRKYSSKGSNLNTIVLYSTSMTSINYCCGNDPTKEAACPKHASISSQKLTSVLTPLQKDSAAAGTEKNRLLVENSYSKDSYSKESYSKDSYSKESYSKEKSPTYFEQKRRYTLEKIVTVGNLLKILLSWNLLRDRIFLWFAISNFLTSLGYYVPYFYTKERCLLLPEMSPNSTDCSFLLSIIGFSSTIGRILFGFISDFHQCNRIYIYAHCLTLCGLGTMLTMFATNYSLLAVFCVLFGLTTGAFVSLTTVIIVDLLGPDRVSNAFGLLLLFQGIASLCGPPIVGLLFDYTSSYDPGFVLIGLAIVISGAMLYFVPCIKKKEKADQYGIVNS